MDLARRLERALDLELVPFGDAEEKLLEVLRWAGEAPVLADLENDHGLAAVLCHDLRTLGHRALDELAEPLLCRLHLPGHT